MNCRQVMKAQAKHIENMEYSISRYIIDVKAYNQCIVGMIKGESPCQYCEDHEECQLAAKDGKGCGDWYLKDMPPVKEEEEDSEDDSKKILLTGATGGE